MTAVAPLNGAVLLSNGVESHDATPASELLHNDPKKPWVIQKFGGTSIGKVPTEIAEDIVKQHLSGHQVALVCSARSSDTKVQGTTNR